MKGNEKVIGTLNELLAEELTAINQYMVHAEMSENWQYHRLTRAIRGRAITEMRHAEKLIERILFLEGTPNVGRLNEVHIGPSIVDQFQNDLKSEHNAVQNYNRGLRQATELGDNGTRNMLEAILRDEEDHVDWLEGQLDQVEQTGLQNYLAQQLREEEE